MGRDPIVDEVRAIREAIAEEHGNDLRQAGKRTDGAGYVEDAAATL